MPNPTYPLPEIEDIFRHNPGRFDEAIDVPSVFRLTGVPVRALATSRCRGVGLPS